MTPHHWATRLTELASRHQVPGASLAILADDEITTAATGVLNLGTGVPVTTDSVFQIGSITKVWTATMLVQLAGEGLLDLDAPLSAVLPELTLATPGATDQITVRHLLSHQSGIDGDMFDDYGRGSDNVQRYVAGCGRLGLLHPPGATMSYCNSGFVIAGRLIEVLTGTTFDEALRARLIEPLGLARTMTNADEAIRFRAACGHLGTGDEQHLAPVWALPGGAGPAGGIIASASDILEFARLHLAGGATADGRQLVSAAGAAAMLTAQVDVPSYPETGRQVGLGWQLHQWDGRPLYSHNGGTIGQVSFLYVLPDRQGAVCLLTNGGQPELLYQDLFGEIFGELWQLSLPSLAEPAPGPVPGGRELAALAGHYEREGDQIDVRVADGGLAATFTDTSPFAQLNPDPVETLPLRPVAADVFAARSKDDDPWGTLIFYQVGGQDYIHAGGRATPRRD